MYVFNASTVTTLQPISVSRNPFDHGENGVLKIMHYSDWFRWIVVAASSSFTRSFIACEWAETFKLYNFPLKHGLSFISTS